MKEPGGWSRQSAQERGYGTAWRKLRNAVMRRDDWMCQPCLRNGRATAATEADHITPKSKGGTDTMGNVQAICRACHQAKTEREAAEAQGRRVKPCIGADGWPLG